MQQSIVWAPQPGPQKALVDCPLPLVFYGGARGGGKGQALDAPVLTPFGFRPMGSLKVGSLITSPDGSVSSVIAVHELGERQLYEVTFQDGTKCEVTGDHLWLAWRSNASQKRKRERRSGEESARIYTMDYIRERVGRRQRFLIPITSAIPFTRSEKHNSRTIDAYALGALLGDGSLCEDYLRLTSEDPEIVERVSNALNEKRLGPYAYGKCPEYRWSAKQQTGDALRYHGLIGKKSHDKFIPSAYLHSPTEMRWDLLRGLMDTDGWVDLDGDIYYCTISTQLRDDVAFLARSLGALVSIRQKQAKDQYGRGSLAYTLRIKLRDSSLAFYLKRKKEKAGRAPQSMGKAVVRVEPSRIAPARCIQVSHLSGLYITNDFIVTHNTDGVLGKWAIKGEHYGKCFNGIFFRKEMPAQDDLIERAKEIYLPIGGSWYEQKKMFILPHGGRVRFRPLENDADAEKYQGQNLTDAAVEEAGQYPASSPIDKLFGALRSVGGVPVQLLLTANPGGPGHHWIKERFIAPAPLGMKVLKWKLDNGKEVLYVYIPSRVQNNKILLQKDPGYIDRLHLVGSKELVRAWLEGDWNVILGAYFDEFRMQTHVLKPFAIPRHWPVYFGYDHGYAAPFAGIWGAVCSGKDDAGREMAAVNGAGETVYIPKGAIIFFREIWGKRVQIPQIASNVLKLKAETWERTAADPAIFKSDGGPSVAEQLASAGLDLAAGDNTRIAGWSQYRLRMSAKEPLFYVFATCPYFIECIQSAQHDEKHPEDLDTTGEDHPLDAGRYLLMARPIETSYQEPKRIDKMGKVTVSEYVKRVRAERDQPRI